MSGYNTAALNAAAEAERLQATAHAVSDLQPPCDWFRLDYVTDSTVTHRPEHCYCECGWTKAHHQ